jgi:hypothetical protein
MQPDQTLSAHTSLDSSRDQTGPVAKPTTLAIGPLLGVLVVFGVVFYAALTAFFPLVTPTQEQLAPFPPEEIAVAREQAFAQGRWLNPLIALTGFAIVLALVLPQVTKGSQASSKSGIANSATWAVLAALLTALGVTAAWGFTEFVALPKSYAMLKTVAGHCVEVGFFSAGVCMAVGAIKNGKGAAADFASRGFLIGFVAAIAFDIALVMVPRMQVDNLFPGGVIWGNRDPLALASWIGVLLVSVLLTLLGVGRKSQPAAKV